MKPYFRITCLQLPLLIIIYFINCVAFAEMRFPKPDFETQYNQPELMQPEQVLHHSEVMFVVILFAVLCFATYFVFKKRSRKGILAVLFFSLFFFGFFKKGCICAVGSLQNVSLAIFDPEYAIPFTVVMIFLLPLIFALFYGRVFCGSVCPLGAIQDILILKPLKIPRWLEHSLGMIPYIYLGLAVLYAATGSAFIICQYDPYIAFFRFHGSYNMIILGLIMLLIGAFIGRAYCRFLCPYSILLRWTSFFAKYHLSITPEDCIQCRLCENACPFGAINKPTPSKITESREVTRKRLARMLLLLPMIILFFGWGFSNLDNILSSLHPTVALAEQIRSEDLGYTTRPTWESATFRGTGQSTRELYINALQIKKQFHLGGWILGIFLGIVFACKLIFLSIKQQRKDYEADHMKCLSCGRCYSFCPTGHIKTNNTTPKST